MSEQAEALATEEIPVAEETQEETQVTEEVDAEPQETEATDEAPEDDDIEEVDYEGQKYAVPKEIKAALMRQADYTRKTQEVAEQRKVFEAHKTSFEQTIEVQKQNLAGYAQLMAIDGQLNQYANVDWNALSQQDPVQAQQAFFSYTQLKDQRGQLQYFIANREQETIATQRAELVKRREEGLKVLQSDISGWSTATQQALAKKAQELGASEGETQAIYQPWIVKALHKAQLFDQLQSKASAKPPTVQAKPAATVRGKTPTQDPSRMSDEDWAKWRDKDLRARKVRI